MGVDQGLRNIGICVVDANGDFVNARTLHPPKNVEGGARLAYILSALTVTLTDASIAHVACEGYAYGKALRAHDMGEAGACIRLAAHAAGKPLVIIPPVIIIRAATGRTQASPEEMIREARARGAAVTDDHQADAFFLARQARAVNVSPVIIPNKTRPRKLRTVRRTSP